MKEILTEQHVPPNGKRTAFHMDWGFRSESMMWRANRPIHPNFHPFASGLRNWMMRKPFDVPVLKSGDEQFSNPYTNSASALANTFMFVVIDCAEFGRKVGSYNSYEAECRALRLYSETVLYAARLCEAFIKQLLFCTSFPENYYRGAALGSLLSRDCPSCRADKAKQHRLSLLGSLAHRYHLCHTYENCLNQHLSLANSRRESQAAHSAVGTFAPGSTSSLQSRFEQETMKTGNDLLHMLTHISEIEAQMLLELKPLIAQYQRNCPVVNLAKRTINRSV